MKTLSLAIVIVLTGCAAAPITSYNPNKLPPEKLVEVTTLQEKEFFNNKYNAWIELIWNEKEEELTKRNPLWDRSIDKVSLPEGKYTFQVACTNGRSEGHPKALFELEAGKKYQIYCDIKKGKGFLGIPDDAYASIKIKEI